MLLSAFSGLVKYETFGPPSAFRTGQPSSSAIIPTTSRGKVAVSPRFAM